MDRAWFVGISKYPSSAGKIKFARRKTPALISIIALATGPRMTSDLTSNVLRYPIASRSPVGTIVHSD